MTSATSESTSNSRSLLPPWLKSTWGIVGIIFILYIILNLAWTYFHWGGQQHIILISNLLSFTPSLLASAIAWRAAVQTSLSASIRRAWLILGMSFFMFLIGNLAWAYLEVVLLVEPFPSLADVFYLAFYPLGLWGLLSLPSVPQNRRERAALWLDLLSVLTAATMFVGYFIIVPTAASSGNDLLTQIIAPAYPIGSLFLTGGILAILYRRPSPNAQSALNLLLVGMIFFVGGDFAFGYTSLTNTYTPGGWTDASWNIAQLFFVLAALRQMHHIDAQATKRREMSLLDRLAYVLPFAATILSYGLVLYVTLTNFSQAAEWLFVAAVLLTILIIARQILGPGFSVASVRTKLLLTFLLVCVLSIGLVSLFTYLTLRSHAESAWQTLLLTTLLVLVLATGAALLLARLFVAPISRLTAVAAQIAAGDLTTKAQVESRDEVGTLAETFNAMLDALSLARQELQESEALYRSLVDYSPDMIAVHSREGRTLFINPAGVKLMGAQSAEEILSRPIMDMVPPDSREEAQRGMENTLAGEPTPLLQQKMHRLDGTSFEAEFRAIPISYAGEPAIQFVMRDITERKRLEEQWHKFKQGIESSSEAVFMTDTDGTIRYINPSFEKVYGYSWDEAVGKTPRILKSGTLPQEVYRQFWGTLLAKGTVAGEIFNRTKDRRLINIEGSNNPIIDENGHITGFLAVHRDVTERKHAEEQIRQLLAEVERQKGELEVRVEQRTSELNALNLRLQQELFERQQLVLSLRDSEARFRLLFAASPDAIVLIDPSDPNTSWPIVDCNEVACHMNGYTREELIGQSIDILNASPAIPAEREDYLKRVRENGILHYEAFHRKKTGHIFPVEISTSLITFEGRELVLGIDRDITERKQSEAALEKAIEIAEAASRAKSEFLSRMSHELRTPMNAILGFAQLLNMSRKEPLTPIQKERVRQITKGGQHLLDLINEILDISRIEAGRLQISPEPVPLRESIQEVLDLTAPLAADRHIQIQSSLEIGANPYVMADRQRLKQVLLNLLSNAVKYNYDGGYVMISCEQSPTGSWRISVTDTGSGISSENLAHLFKPFERLVTDESGVEGTGLGLALAKRLVELMKGQIGVESVVGQGSTFWIELPSAESQLERLQRTGGTGQLPVMSPTARTLLYVEDNIANFELIQQVLADYEQIELLWAADPQTGIESARLNHPSLILLDLHLGGRDGAEVLKQLKEDVETAPIPVVVVSADATPGQIERLIALGAHSYLTKPLDIKHFIQIIEELLTAKEN